MTTIQMIIRFQKADQYSNNIFIVGKEEKEENYNTLTGYSDKLKTMGLTTFLPIYSSDKFATIRFKNNKKFRFVEGNTYALTFEIRKKLHNEKEFVSCYVLNSKLDSVAPPVDYGDVLEL